MSISPRQFAERGKAVRKELVEISQCVAHRIRDDVKRATMCWKNLDSGNRFDIDTALEIAVELAIFVEDKLEESYLKGYGDATRELTEIVAAGEPGMPTGYKFDSEVCPECGQPVAANWIVRHRKANCEVG